MNARFWTYVHNSPVKITLRPMQVLEHHTFTRHDEGWSAESVTWHSDGATVYREIVTDGVDCDGRLRTVYADRCPRDKLCALDSDDGLHIPEWTHRDRRQIDYSAEAAGY